MRKQSVLRMVVLAGLIQMASNIAHPFTPKLFTGLGLPDYMFGVAFASMSLGAFLTSPLWGKLSDNKGRAMMMMTGCFGYALGQIFFGLSTTVWQVALARLISGLFSIANSVCAMAYVVDGTSPEQRGRYLSYLAAATSTGACAGYFVGGIIGDFSVRIAFLVQAALLVLFGIAAFVMLKEFRVSPESYPITMSEVNPFRAFLDARSLLTGSLVVFLLMIFFVNFGFYGFDNALNYYLKRELDFPTTYNGVIKAVVGLLGLLCNFTLNIWLVRHTHLRRSFYLLLFLTAASILSCIWIPSVAVFVVVNIFSLVLCSINVPMQQFLVTRGSRPEQNGIVVGIYNAALSVGMMGGTLFAGFIYTAGAKLPFICMAAAFLVAAVLGVINARQYRGEAEPEHEAAAVR